MSAFTGRHVGGYSPQFDATLRDRISTLEDGVTP